MQCTVSLHLILSLRGHGIIVQLCCWDRSVWTVNMTINANFRNSSQFIEPSAVQGDKIQWPRPRTLLLSADKLQSLETSPIRQWNFKSQNNRQTITHTREIMLLKRLPINRRFFCWKGTSFNLHLLLLFYRFTVLDRDKIIIIINIHYYLFANTVCQ